ncbi:MAG: hypothetical protein ACO25K_08455 [Candidatus Fonsibacter ubiquis]
MNINLYSKNSILYDQLDGIEKIETRAVDLVENLLLSYIKILAKLKRVDRMGSFESDDEVGFVFKAIKRTIEDLKEELENIKKALKEETEK